MNRVSHSAFCLLLLFALLNGCDGEDPTKWTPEHARSLRRMLSGADQFPWKDEYQANLAKFEQMIESDGVESLRSSAVLLMAAEGVSGLDVPSSSILVSYLTVGFVPAGMIIQDAGGKTLAEFEITGRGQPVEFGPVQFLQCEVDVFFDQSAGRGNVKGLMQYGQKKWFQNAKVSLVDANGVETSTTPIFPLNKQ